MAARLQAVLNLNQLTQVELRRYQEVLDETNRHIRNDRQIPRDSLQGVLDANARAIHRMALDRGFYSEAAAQNVEIDVQVNARIITQKPETLGAVVRKNLIQTIFVTLGWTIAEANPLIGAVVFSLGSISGSDACKEKSSNLY